MNKRELSQLKHLSKEIELLQKQIENAEYAVDAKMTTETVTGSSPVWPYEERQYRIEGIDVAGYERRVRRLKNQLSKRLEDLIDKREELEEYIDSVDDSQLRMILALRYVNGLNWRKEFRERVQAEYQKKFEKKYGHEKFMQVFRKNYIKDEVA